MDQNFPNPFNSATTIAYHVMRPSPLVIEIYDIGGQKVCELARGFHVTVSYQAIWDGRDGRRQRLASGVYFYSLRADGVHELRKMLYLK